MFGLSFWEIGVILAVALIVLGPSKLPEIARSLGKGLREFRKATEDFRSQVTDEVYKSEPRPTPPAELPPSIGKAADAELVHEEQKVSPEVKSEPKAQGTEHTS